LTADPVGLPPAAAPAAASAATPSDLTRALRATRVQFLCLGALAGAWGVHVPSAKLHFGLSEMALSGLLLCGGLGVIASLLFAGRIVARLGARGTVRLGAALSALGLAAVLLPPTLPLALLAMAVWGVAGTLMDMAMNAEGTVLESQLGRPVMSGLHGMWSVGGMAGAALCGMLLRAEAGTPAAQLAGFSLGVGLLSLLTVGGMLPVHPAARGTAGAGVGTGERDPEAHFVWPRGPLLLIGLLLLCGMTAEGVMYDWSVLYMKQELGQSQAFASLAYISFAGAMALARFAGDGLRARVSERRLLTGGGLTAAGAMTVALLSGQPVVAVVCFAIAGAGLAAVAPVLFNAATRVPGISRAAAISAATSVGYAGFMLGPSLIGALAELSSLSWALAVLVPASLLVAIGTRFVPVR